MTQHDPNTAQTLSRYAAGSPRCPRCQGALHEIEEPVAARPTRLIAVAAGALIVLTGCTSDPEPESSPTPAPSTSASAPVDLAAFYDQEVDWKGCDGDFDCATLTVPADYDDPESGTLELEVIRLRAKDPIGSLILNPGGPGGSGFRSCLQLPAETGRRHHQVAAGRTGPGPAGGI